MTGGGLRGNTRRRPAGLVPAGHAAALLGLLGAALLGAGCAGRPPGTVTRTTPEGVRAQPYVSPFQYEHYLRGEIALASGQPALAAREFAEARTGSADDAFLRARHAQALIEAGEWSRAERVLDDALRRFPASLELLLTQARYHAAQGREAEALETLAQAARVAPTSARPPLAQAALLMEHGRAAQAAAVLDEYLSRHPEAPAFAARLELAVQRADVEDALRVVLAWSPQGTHGGAPSPVGAESPDDVALRRVAELALAQGRPEVAVRALEQVADTPRARVLRVRALAQAGRAAEAEAQLALVQDADVGGQEARAELYLLVRRPDVALELLGDAAARPAQATAHQAWLIGTCLVRLGRAAEAATWLARVPPDATDSARARAELVRALRLVGLPQLAAEVSARGPTGGGGGEPAQ